MESFRIISWEFYNRISWSVSILHRVINESFYHI